MYMERQIQHVIPNVLIMSELTYQLPANSKWKKISIGAARNWWTLETNASLKGSTPIINSIVVFDSWPNHPIGHVGIVVDIKKDSLLINHANWHTKAGEKNCSITKDWFLLSLDKKKLNNKYPIRGFIYAWGTKNIGNLSALGYGDIRFGEKLSNAEQKTGEKGKKEYGDYFCHYVHFNKYPNLSFMIENGIVTRVDINFFINTEYGLFYKGMSTDKLIKSVPNIRVEEKCEPYKRKEYIIENKSRNFAIILEEVKDDLTGSFTGKVLKIKAGLYPSVNAGKGCL